MDNIPISQFNFIICEGYKLTTLMTDKNKIFYYSLLIASIKLIFYNMKIIRNLFNLMKSIVQKLLSLNSPVTNHIKSNVIKPTLRITLLFYLLYIISWHYNILFTILLSLSRFSDLDTILNTLINLPSIENSIYILTLPLIITKSESDIKMFDYKIINETMDYGIFYLYCTV